MARTLDEMLALLLASGEDAPGRRHALGMPIWADSMGELPDDYLIGGADGRPVARPAGGQPLVIPSVGAAPVTTGPMVHPTPGDGTPVTTTTPTWNGTTATGQDPAATTTGGTTTGTDRKRQQATGAGAPPSYQQARAPGSMAVAGTMPPPPPMPPPTPMFTLPGATTPTYINQGTRSEGYLGPDGTMVYGNDPKGTSASLNRTSVQGNGTPRSYADNTGPAALPVISRPATATSTPPPGGGGGAPPGGDAMGDWNREFAEWVRKQMANPSRYDADLVRQGQAVLEEGLTRSRATGMRGLGEHYASRGLTDSSLEGFSMGDLEAQLQEQFRKGSFELGQDQARTWATDMGTAGNLGATAGGMLTDEQIARWNQQYQQDLLRYEYEDPAGEDPAGEDPEGEDPEEEWEFQETDEDREFRNKPRDQWTLAESKRYEAEGAFYRARGKYDNLQRMVSALRQAGVPIPPGFETWTNAQRSKYIMDLY